MTAMNRKGFYLFTLPANFEGTASVFDDLTGQPVATWDNGLGGTAGAVRRNGVYRMELRDASGGGMGWYFRGRRVEDGYNFFALNASS